MSLSLQYSTDNGSSWTTINSITGNQHLLTGLRSSTPYWVRLRTVDASGTAHLSNVASFSTDCEYALPMVQIGNDRSNTYLPNNSYYKYSYTQQIYTSEEMAGATTIHRIAAQYWYPDTTRRQLKIYMGHTDRTSFNSTSIYMPVDSMTLVFDGNVTWNNQGNDHWFEIQLDTPFNYNGTDNLMLAINDQSGFWVSDERFFGHYASGMALNFYTDDHLITASNPLENAGQGGNYLGSEICVVRSNIMFMGQCPDTGCVIPDLAILSVTDTSATYYTNGDANTSFELQDRYGNTIGSITTTGNTFSGLAPNTSYKLVAINTCYNEQYSRSASFTTAPPHYDRHVYVSNSYNSVRDGLTWATAFNNLQDAINVAAVSAEMGDTVDVWVAEGEYYNYNTQEGSEFNNSQSESHEYNSFIMKGGVDLYGGFMGNEPADYDLSQRPVRLINTTLNGNGKRVILHTNKEHTIIDGFRIMNGYTGSYYDYNGGSGILSWGNLELRNSIVMDCSGSYYSAICITNDGISQDTFPSRISNCIFADNNSNFGNLMLNSTTIENCFITDNECQFYGNIIAEGDVTVDHCTMVRNRITGNYYPFSQSGNITISNSIIWDNSNNMGSQLRDNMTVHHSAIENGTYCYTDPELHNITLSSNNDHSNGSALAPLFYEPDGYDFTLTLVSPCIDAADNASTAPYDLFGNPRRFGTATDMGCYENQGTGCPQARNLIVDSVSIGTATLSWDALEIDSVEYIIEYIIDNDSNDEVQRISGITDTTYTLTNLAGDVTYKAWVRVKCRPNDTSLVASMLSFTTPCPYGANNISIAPELSGVNYLPTQTYYNYSYTQQIFDATELGSISAEFTGIEFQYYYSSTIARRIAIYMGTTNQSTFTSTSNPIPLSSLTQVYNGTVNFQRYEDYWYPITFNQPFAYDGVSNLVIAVVDSTGSYQSGYPRFYGHNCNQSKSIYYYRDSAPIDLNNPTSGSQGTLSYRNNIRLTSACPEEGCPLVNLSVNNITSSSAEITCTPNGESDQVVIEYAVMGSTTFDTLATTYGTHTLSNLTPYTQYLVRARSRCNDTWGMAVTSHFTTQIPNYDRHIYVTADGTGSGLSWDDPANLNHAIAMANVCDEEYDRFVNIWVAEGLYLGDTNATVAISLMPHTQMYGGFQGNEPADYDISQRDIQGHPSVLSGQNLRPIMQHTTLGRALVDGFTFTQGLGTSTKASALTSQGNTIIRNCTFTNNRNYYTLSVSRVSGVISATISHCAFTNNTSNYNNVYLQFTDVDHCQFYNNRTTGNYATVYLNASSSLNYCNIIGNYCNNSAVQNYISNGMSNCIVWGNNCGTYPAVPSDMTMRNCAIQGTFASDGTNGNFSLSEENIGIDPTQHYPYFEDPEDGIFTLMPNSACIDAGDTNSTIATDYSGKPRLYGSRTDIGCYEYNGENCFRPMSPVVEQVGSTSALVTWMTTIQGSTTQVELSADQGETWTIAGSSTATQYVLSELTSSTQYLVRLRSICDNDESSNATNHVSFTTQGESCSPDLTIGTATTNGSYLPTNNYYNYSYTQQIFSLDETSDLANTITQIGFQYNYSSPLTRTLNIFLGETDKNYFTSTNDFVPASQLRQVFSGNVTFQANADSNYWVFITFDSAYTYSHNNSLVVAVQDMTGSYEGSYSRFLVHTTINHQSIYYYRDGSVITTTNPMSGGPSNSIINTRNNIRLRGQCGATDCPRPDIIVSDITDSSAQIYCFTNNVTATTELEYSLDGHNYITLGSGSNFTLTGLMPYRTVYLRASNLCGQANSSYAIRSFTTQPLHYDHIYVKPQASGNGKGDSWENATNDLQWAMNMSVQAPTFGDTIPTIWVAAGNYKGDLSAPQAYILPDEVKLYGGFAGNEPSDYNLALRDLEQNASVLDGNNTHLVLKHPTNGPALVDGFTLTNGQGNNNSYSAGVYSTGAINMRNCRLSNFNTTKTLLYFNNSNAVVDHCVLTDNYSDEPLMNVYNTIISNTLIANNSCPNSNILNINGPNSRIENSTIVSNLSYNPQPAIYASSSSILVSNSIIWGNQSTYTSSPSNSVYFTPRNSAFDAIYSFTGNNGNICISHANNGIQGPAFVQPSLVVGRRTALQQNEPVSWQLTAASPCVNRGGSYILLPIATDLAGVSRVRHDTIDMGCYESDFSCRPLPTYSDGIVYVKMGGQGLKDGTSWSNALDDLNEALEMASITHSNVWVATGTYYGSDQATSAFTILPGVNVYGGFAGNEPTNFDLASRNIQQNATILDGRGAQRVLYQNNNFTSSTSCTWDGFTITNGDARNLGSYNYGGGAFLRNYTSLKNCVIEGCQGYYGGGVYAEGHNTIENCLLHDNYASYCGGGIYANNSTIEKCQVLNNRAANNGGGFYGYNDTIRNSVIAHNVGYYGAGFYGTSYIANCVIANNTITSSYNYYGAGIYYTSSTTNIYNTIIWGNKHNYTPDNYYNAYSSSDSYPKYCAIEEGDTTNHCFTLASSNDGYNASEYYVRFIDPANNDYHLHVSSPCVDNGDSTVPHTTTDMDGNPRIFGSTIDMGAYEVQDVNNCSVPLNLVVSNVTSNSATISWHTDNTPDSWVLTFAINGDNDSVLIVSDTMVTLTGLQFNRTYKARVRSRCGNDLSVFSIPVYFTTVCDSAALTPLTPMTTFSPNSDVVYGTSVNFNWTALNMATFYDFYLWEDGDAEPSTPTRSGLTNSWLDNIALPQYQHGKQYHWKVVAWNECLNLSSNVIDFTTCQLPNLHVASFVNSTPVSNQTMTIEWTVRNDGQGATPPGQTWKDYIWIAGINEIGGGFLYNVDEVLLATVPNLTSLNPGESYTNSTQVTLPADYIGNYYIFVISDQYNAVGIDYSPTGDTIPPIPYTPSLTGTPYPYLTSSNTGWPSHYVHSEMEETNETDNFFYKWVTVLPPPSPDLQVTHISHPTNAFSNTDITIQWTVSNMGEAATVSNRWRDAVYISPDPVFNLSTATHLTTVEHNENLAINSSYTQSAQVHLPITFMGTYYIYVTTDVSNLVYEGLMDENNTSVTSQTIDVTLTPPADLVVTGISMPTDSVSNGASYALTYTVTNMGVSQTENSYWYDRLYIDTCSTFRPDQSRYLNAFRHNGSLSADSSYTATVSFSIPNNLIGAYYVYLKADGDNDIFEYMNEDNNVMRKATPIVICQPDLVPEILSIPDSINPNEEFDIVWRVTNNGVGDLPRTSVYNRFLINGAQFYTASFTTALQHGESYEHTSRVKVGCVSDSIAHITMSVDPTNLIFEGLGEANNITPVHNVVTRTPDLHVSNISLPTGLWSGTQIPVSWVLHNSGNGTLNNPVTTRFYLNQSSSTYLASDSIGNHTQLTVLNHDSSIIDSAIITLPNGINGNYYLHIVVNADNAICEGANTHANVAHSSVRAVQLTPYPDLVPTQIIVPDTISVGQLIPIQYRIANQGIAGLQGVNVATKFYISNMSYFNVNYATLLGTDEASLSLDINQSALLTTALVMPSNVSAGNRYIYAVADANDNVYEYTGETNNTLRSNLVNVKVYPLDLRIESIQGPQTMEWGQTATFAVTVKNNSTVPTLASSWEDRLFISNDNVYNNSDIRVPQNQNGQTLNPGESYTLNYSVTIPFGSNSNIYLIAIADFNNANPDINNANNLAAYPLSVTTVPTPDLAISQFSIVNDEIVSGQAAQLVYTVSNQGSVSINAGSWNDKVFLSTSANANFEIGSKTMTQKSLAAGESYTDTLIFTVPLPNNGNLNFKFSANAANTLFETNRSNNDSTFAHEVSLPLPGDLVVRNITIPDTLTSGQKLNANWTIANIGENSLSGRNLRTLVYLSTDTVFDANDKMIGNAVTSVLELAPGESLTQQSSMHISGFNEGNYYIIVKTNVTNAFNEVNSNNNSSTSAQPFYLRVKLLPFNTTVNDTLVNNQSNDYKLEVGDQLHETVRIRLASNDSTNGALNMLYVSHNAIGNNLNYTYSTTGQYTGNPELYIPSTESGYYGVNVYGTTPAGTQQATGIRADILPFELISCEPNHGGNTGLTTVELTGSRFRPDMQVMMRRGNDTIRCQNLQYDSYYRVFATFDLNGNDTGVYNVSALNYCEGEATLNHAFTIEPGRPDDLLYKIDFPNAPRPNRNIVLMLEFSNNGNTDIQNAILEIISVGGAHISLTPEGLNQHQTSLTIPLTIDGEPNGVLRPGAYGSINIHCFTSGSLIFRINRVR